MPSGSRIALPAVVALLALLGGRVAAAPDAVRLWMPAFAPPDERAGIEEHYLGEAARLYGTANRGIAMDVTLIPWAGGEYGRRLLAAVAAGDPPDLVGYADATYMTGASLPGAETLRIDIPIARYYAREELDRMGPAVLRAATDPTKPDSFLFFPTTKSVSWGIIAVNRRMFDEAGYQDDAIWKSGGWTFDELREAARRLTRRGDTQTAVWGFAESLSEAPFALELFLLTREQPQRGPVVMRRGQPERVRDYEAYRTVFALAQDLIARDAVWPASVLGLPRDDIVSMFVQDQTVAMVVDGWYGLGQVVDQHNADVATGRKPGKLHPGVVWLPAPRFPSGGPFFHLYIGGIGAYRQRTSRGAAHVANVLAAGRYLSSPLLCYYWSVVERSSPVDPRTRELYPDSFSGNRKLDLVAKIQASWPGSLFADDPSAPVPPALAARLDEIASPFAGANAYRGLVEDVCRRRVTPEQGARKTVDAIDALIADWKAGRIR